MKKSADEIAIVVKSGNGGDGCVSFLREKYVPLGGPDGGDGGKGGDVYLQARKKVRSLAHLNSKPFIYKAQSGHTGGKRNRTGHQGKDIIIPIPLGSQLYDDRDVILHDFVTEEKFLLTQGGRGGKGNAFFKNSVRQSPRFFQPGELTEEKSFALQLKLIADVGLVGFPNAGKSTLLRALTQANPKIANYPFTTLQPNLGVLEYSNEQVVYIADIPGILEGAHQGYGLGLYFLRHIERVRVIIYVLDINMDTSYQVFSILQQELSSYNPLLIQKPFCIIINKIDLISDESFLDESIAVLKKNVGKDIPMMCISSQEGTNVDLLKTILLQLLNPVGND